VARPPPPLNLQDLPEELHSLVYYPERAQLLAITAAAGVLVLGKAEDGRGWEVVLRMKLPAGAAGGTAGLKVSRHAGSVIGQESLGAQEWWGAAQGGGGVQHREVVGNLRRALCCVLQVVWAGRHTLASASDKERLVRLFDFDSEDNYVLNTDTEAGASSTVAALAYDAR
jgi:hypothetical protein